MSNIFFVGSIFVILFLFRVPTIEWIRTTIIDVFGYSPELFDMTGHIPVLVVHVVRVLRLGDGHGRVRHLQRVQALAGAKAVALLDEPQGASDFGQDGRPVRVVEPDVVLVFRDRRVGQDAHRVRGPLVSVEAEHAGALVTNERRLGGLQVRLGLRQIGQRIVGRHGGQRNQDEQGRQGGGQTCLKPHGRPSSPPFSARTGGAARWTGRAGRRPRTARRRPSGRCPHRRSTAAARRRSRS